MGGRALLRSWIRIVGGPAHVFPCFVLALGLALGLTGCGTLPHALRGESAVLASLPTPSPVSEAPAVIAVDLPVGGPQIAQTQRAPGEKLPVGGANDAIEEEYDPWEPFNEKTFEFNRKLDRYLLKPVAKAYNKVVPDQVQVMIGNAFDNIRWVPRAVNSLLQAKWDGAARELSRFMLNSTLGVGGLFDVGKYAGIEKSREDFGQTLGTWGAGPGPYLVLPFLEPMTVRDGVGQGVDLILDPLGYFFAPSIPFRLGMKVGDTVNDRSLNLDLYQGFEETVIDMYSAVRQGYLQRREKLIKE